MTIGYESRLQIVDSRLRSLGAEAVVAASPENVLHMSGAYIVSQRMIRDRLAMTLHRLSGGPVFLVADVIYPTAIKRSRIEDTRPYVEHHQSPMQALAQVIQKNGLARSTIALEICYLPAASYLELATLLPEVTFVDAEQILNETRMVKAQEELEWIDRLAEITERAIERAYTASRAGDTEAQVADKMKRAFMELGGEWVPFMTLAAGVEHTGQRHHVPGSRPIQPGDILTTALVGYREGWYAGFGRMAVVQEPSKAQKDAYRQVTAVQRRMMELAKPGVRACDLYQSCVDYCAQVDLPFHMKNIGHGIGLALHEYPILGPNCEEKLRVDMALCIEIASEIPGLGRYYVEDLIVVKERDYVLVTDHMNTAELTMII